MKKILTVCLSPCFQYTVPFECFREDEVNRTSGVTVTASGKGVNVTRVLEHLGKEALNLTVLGGPRVQEFLSYCQKLGVKVEYVESKAPTRVCTTILNRTGNTSTELVEEAHEVEGTLSKDFLSLYCNRLEGASALIISGTKAKGFNDDLYPLMVKEASSIGKLVILDIKGKDLRASLASNPSIIKPNLSEFAHTFLEGRVLQEKDESLEVKDLVSTKMKELYDTYGTRTILSRGVFPTWAYDGSSFLEFPVPEPKRQVLNTTGCGDTLTAALASALLDGKDFTSSIAYAMEKATERATRENLL